VGRLPTAQEDAVNETLRRALADARKNDVDVSSALGVDPKTVQRWLAGRVPLRQHRWALADLIGRHEYDLWPELVHGNGAAACPEIQAVYPHRGAVPREVWRELFESAREQIGVLVYAGLFLAEDVELLRVFAERARAGVAVRVLLGDPDSPEVAQRGAEEGIDDAISAKIRNTIVLYRSLLREDSVEIRLHRTVLYNSIYRADDEMLVNPHVYGAAAAYAPILHLRQAAHGDLVTTYLDSFERVWSEAAVLN
jgi:hypothetical protein